MPLDSPRPSPKIKVRLQKFLADCGVASRRASEVLITDGAVAVDGQVVTQLGTRIDPEHQQVRVHGEPVAPAPLIYLLLHKPPGVLCTNQDPEGRDTYLELLPELPGRVYTVGRLDMMSEGLLLVTNDGAFAQRMSHPSHQFHKTYRVWLDRSLSPEEQRQLERGVREGGERLRALTVRPARSRNGEFVYTMVLGEGRNRHIRRMAAAIGCHVRRLRRTAIGPLRLEDLTRGSWRFLTSEERGSLGC